MIITKITIHIEKITNIKTDEMLLRDYKATPVNHAGKYMVDVKDTNEQYELYKKLMALESNIR